MDAGARIYVAGHRGLVGSALMRALASRGYTNLVTRTHAELDLTDQAATEAFFAREEPEYVFLAAARVGGIHANDACPAEFIRDNLQIEVNVIEAARRQGVKKLLFLGSSCIYPSHAPQPLKEEYLLTGPLEPTNQWYAVAKIAGIKLCQAYRKQYGCNFICAMPTNLYGSNDNFDLETSHVLPALIRKFHLARLARTGDLEAVVRNERRYGRIPDKVLNALGLRRSGNELAFGGKTPVVCLWGSGTPRREFLHVEDLADACLFLMAHYDDGEIINVGVGEDVTVRELAEMVREIVGFEGEIVWDHSRPDGTPRKLLDVGRMQALGWRARIGLREGVTAVYRCFREQ